MKKEKVLTLAAATAMLAGNTAAVYAHPVTNLNETQTTTTKDDDQTIALQQDVLNNKKQYEEKKDAYEQAEAEKAKADAILAEAKSSYDKVNNVANIAYEDASSAIIGDLEKQIDVLEEAQAKLDDARAEKESLNKQAEEKNAAFEEALENIKITEAELAKAKENAAAITPEALAQAQQNVVDAKVKLAEITTELTEIESKLAKAQEVVEQAQVVLDTANAKVKQATIDKEAADAQYQEAQSKLQEAKDILASIQGQGDAYEQAKQQLALAEQDVLTALAAQEKAEIAVADAIADQESMQKAYDADYAAYMAMSEELQKAQKMVDLAKDNVTKAEEVVAQKESEYQNIEQEIKVAEAELEKKEAALEEANAKANAVYAEKKKIDTEVAEAEKKVTDLELIASNAQAQYNQGSLGFFTYMGDKAAVDTLKDAKYSDYTHIGNDKDATSLVNMRNTLKFLKECNELRAKHGLAPLKVNGAMMAAAQSNLNWSAIHIDHSQQYSVGENLAWGYTDPFDGWYYYEKELYEEDPIKNAGKIGHYLNIINPDYTVTGFAISQYGEYSESFGQVFDWGVTGIDVDTYFAQFEAYYQSIVNADESLANAKAELVKKIAEQKKVQEKCDEAEALVNDASQAKWDAFDAVMDKNAELVSKSNEIVDAEMDLAHKQNVLATANSTLTYVEIAEKEAYAQLKKSEAGLNHTKVIVDKRRTALDEAKAVVAEKEAKVAELKENLKKYEIGEAEAKANVEKMQKEADAAQAVAIEAEKAYTAALAEASEKQNAFDTVYQEMMAQKNAKDALQKEVVDAQTAYDTSVAYLNTLTSLLQKVKDAENKLEQGIHTRDRIDEERKAISQKQKENELDITFYTDEAADAQEKVDTISLFKTALDHISEGKEMGELPNDWVVRLSAFTYVNANTMHTFAEYKELLTKYETALEAVQPYKETYEAALLVANEKTAEYEAAKKAYVEAEAALKEAETKLNDYINEKLQEEKDKDSEKDKDNDDKIVVDSSAMPVGDPAMLMALTGAMSYMVFKRKKKETEK